MGCRLRRSFFILVLATATIPPTSVATDVDVPWHRGHGGVAAAAPRRPRAHELDSLYTFEQYLLHFGKYYDNPDEYARRSRIFTKNLNKILSHNEGKMDENGNILPDVGGYVMGVNIFTDYEINEIPKGYNKRMHPSWRTQFEGGQHSLLKIERLLSDLSSYSVSVNIPTLYVSVQASTASNFVYSVPSIFHCMNKKPPAFHMDDVSNLPIEVDWAKEGKVNSIIPQQGGCGSCWSFAATASIESNLAIITGEEPTSLSVTNMLLCTPNPDECGGKY